MKKSKYIGLAIAFIMAYFIVFPATIMAADPYDPSNEPSVVESTNPRVPLTFRVEYCPDDFHYDVSVLFKSEETGYKYEATAINAEGYTAQIVLPAGDYFIAGTHVDSSFDDIADYFVSIPEANGIISIDGTNTISATVTVFDSDWYEREKATADSIASKVDAKKEANSQDAEISSQASETGQSPYQQNTPEAVSPHSVVNKFGREEETASNSAPAQVPNQAPESAKRKLSPLLICIPIAVITVMIFGRGYLKK